MGSKWIGIYCLASATGELFKAFPLTFTYFPELRQSVPLFKVSHWLSFMGFIGFLTVGIFLIRHGSYILKFAFQGDLESTIEDSKDFFDAAIKLYGLYLIAGAIPVCVWLLANALIALGAPPYMSVDDELDRIKSYLLSVLTTPGLGMCGVFWSSRITGLAFRQSQKSGS